MTFPVLAALLCLGRKYDIQKLRAEARKRIYAQYPTTLEEVRDWAGFDPPDRFRSAQLLAIARRAGLVSILPRVFYACCVLYNVSDLTAQGSDFSILPADQMTCLTGHRAMCQAQAETTFAWAYSTQALAAGCATPQSCNGARHRYLTTRFLPVAKDFGLQDWSRTSTRIDGMLCGGCLEVARERHEAGRAEFWKRLPNFFNLPSWEELSKEREDM